MFLFLTISVLVTGTLATPSTQIWIPSTDIQPFLNPHLGWDIYLTTYGNGLLSNGGITMGVLPFKKMGMEIGIDYRDINGNHRNPVLFNAKIGTPEEAFFKYMPALAVGGYDFGLRKDVTSFNILYGLVAKNLWKLGRFSVGGYKGGVFWANPQKLFFVASKGFDPVNGGARKVDDAGVLASWDRTMDEISKKLWLAFDFQSGLSGYGAANVGLSWSFCSNVSTLVAYDFYLDERALNPTFTLQFDLNLF
jgi:hypothetical protein